MATMDGLIAELGPVVALAIAEPDAGYSCAMCGAAARQLYTGRGNGAGPARLAMCVVHAARLEQLAEVRIGG